PYLEAIRQISLEHGRANTALVHLTLVPYLAAAGELKTKPTQHSVKTLQSYGLQPDVLVCRTEHPLPADVRRKIALFCNVETEAVIECRDAESIYEVPMLLREQKLDRVVMERLTLASGDDADAGMETWIEAVRRLKTPDGKVTVAMVGKYVEHQDAYKSISESFLLAGGAAGVQVEVRSVLSDDLTADNVDAALDGASGVLVAPGFGDRGIDGKIEAVRWARETGVPFLGICLGMQVACIEYARNVCGKEGAHSTEFAPEAAFPIISLMAEQKDVTDMGGTMRLGEWPCAVVEGTIAHEVYGQDLVGERHRHRYEVNNDLRYALREGGLTFSGVNPAKDLVEIIELPRPAPEASGDGAPSVPGGPAHPWFVGVQFHPEYRSTVQDPHPLFVHFVTAAAAHAKASGGLDEPKEPSKTRKVRRSSARVLSGQSGGGKRDGGRGTRGLWRYSGDARTYEVPSPCRRGTG
ncbi:MAG: CTP synthase, partial [Bacteroidota bacterium]